MDLENKRFQQDGLLDRESIALLRDKFPGRVISRRGDMQWPPRHANQPH